ncbi:MAG: hypothetical protein NTY38_02270 [Acidobacteria bacterium]|nr:hypothetical protein [Acidobacteriota bacterium]
MARTSKQLTTCNGFAIPLQADTDLGLAMLIAESEDGQHEPVAVVGTINEAREAAENDFRDRMRRLELGEDAGLCPALYKVWARGIDGSYRLACEITACLR